MQKVDLTAERSQLVLLILSVTLVQTAKEDVRQVFVREHTRAWFKASDERAQTMVERGSNLDLYDGDISVIGVDSVEHG